ncbi:MAG: LPD38 domain-containing protein, partial [Sulfuricella sp.]
FTKSRPDNLKMFRATKNTPFDKTAQAIAGAGEALGAGRYENDISKVSPETLKYAWRTYTGGLGTFITDTVGLGSMMASDPSQVVSSEVPFVKDFYKANDVRPLRSRFYQLADEANAAAAEFKEAKKAGDGEAIDKMFARPGTAELISLEKLVKQTAKSAAQVRDQEVDINADPALSPAEKKKKLKELEKVEEEIYRSAIDAFK